MWREMFTTLQGWLSLLVTFALGGALVAVGEVDFHMLMVILGMFTTLVSSIGRIGRTYADLQIPIAGAKRLFAILDRDIILGQDIIPRSHTKKKTKKNAGYALTIRNLCFTYTDADSPTLSGIDLEIDENKMVAFIGESGCGKSTLLKIIIGMYQRDDFDMSVGGLPFNETPIKDWKSYFAYVDQDCKLLNMSIKENIAMGLAGKADENEIIAAAKRAAAHDFIMELEGGYDAPCGDGGNLLSGGQKQRIAIARALVKKAPILVFDEITSALDKDTGKQIMDTIESLRSDHTILYITHNKEATTTADTVITLTPSR
jgi:ABC-type multidrug transport system fused ATPase/permease subunit